MGIGCWAIPDLRLSLQLERHVCIELSYLLSLSLSLSLSKAPFVNLEMREGGLDERGWTRWALGVGQDNSRSLVGRSGWRPSSISKWTRWALGVGQDNSRSEALPTT